MKSIVYYLNKLVLHAEFQGNADKYCEQRFGDTKNKVYTTCLSIIFNDCIFQQLWNIVIIKHLT